MTIGDFNLHSTGEAVNLEDVARLSTAWIDDEYAASYEDYVPAPGKIVAVNKILEAGY